MGREVRNVVPKADAVVTSSAAGERRVLWADRARRFPGTARVAAVGDRRSGGLRCNGVQCLAKFAAMRC